MKNANQTHGDRPQTFKSLTGKTAREWIRLAVNVPPRVEKLVAEIKESSPNYDDAKVWATAWSIYCKHIDPGSDHCHKPTSDYLQKKASPEEGKSNMATKHDDQLRADTIRLAHAKPELQKFLLPIIKEADAEKKAGWMGEEPPLDMMMLDEEFMDDDTQLLDCGCEDFAEEEVKR